MRPVALPNGHKAVVEIAKLTDYCLNPQHEDGKHKARAFASALGLGREDAEWNSLPDRLVVNHIFRLGSGAKRLDRSIL